MPKIMLNTTPLDKVEEWSNIVSTKIREGKQIMVFFDTETTGGVSGATISVVEKKDLKYEGKLHRMVEIGASVTVLDEKTGKCEPLLDSKSEPIRFHEYLNIWSEDKNKLKRINSMQEMPFGAFRVHGISKEFLEGKTYLGKGLEEYEKGDVKYYLKKPAPTFEEVIEPLMKITGLTHKINENNNEKKVIYTAHNAEFDNKFMNSEFQLIGLSPFESYAASLCTLMLAKDIIPKTTNPADYGMEGKKFSYSLDKLYQFVNNNGFSNEKEIPRDLHGAMVDTRIMLNMYNGLTNTDWYKNAPNTPLSEMKISEDITEYLKKYEKQILRRPLPRIKKATF